MESGTATLPSACCPFSSTAMRVRGSPSPEPFSVCANSGFAPAAGRNRILGAPRLVVVVQGAARHLEPAADARRPYLEVVRLRIGEAEVAAGQQQHAVAQAEPLQHGLRVRRQLVERRAARVRPLEPHQLDLVELVHAQDAARVLAVRAGLAPEARRVRHVALRQRVLGPEQLAGVHVRDRHLRRRDQVEPVLANVVHLVGILRQVARAEAAASLTRTAARPRCSRARARACRASG
jgi:hypothetical protein